MSIRPNRLKAVLLHNENKHPLFPTVRAFRVKESHDSTNLLVWYTSLEYLWKTVCSRTSQWLTKLKKFRCFLCKWDSQAQKVFTRKDNRPFNISVSRAKNRCALHLSRMKFSYQQYTWPKRTDKFVKVKDKNGSGLLYCKQKFPKIGVARTLSGFLSASYILFRAWF